MKRGGKRKNAGRKPLADKKEVVTLYIAKSVIKAKGGEEKLKQFLYESLV